MNKPTIRFQTLRLSQIAPPTINPREQPGDLSGIADSIRDNGLLQNLAVRPLDEDNPDAGYRIAFTSRRYLALKKLEAAGEIGPDYEVMTAVLTGITDDDERRLALIENVQRKSLHPLEEGKAWQALLENGGDIANLAAYAGVTPKTIRRRLALNDLSAGVRDAFQEGQLNLAQAQAFTLGTVAQQDDMLKRMTQSYYDAEDIQEILEDERPTKAMAIFDFDAYTGATTDNLFADDDTTLVDDVDQFMALQRQAVEALAKQYEADGAAWVVVDESRFPNWYKWDKDAKAKGVVIWFGPGGHVEVRENLKERTYSPTTATTLSAADRPKPPRPFYGASLCRDIARHKTLALQDALVNNPRKARELAAVQLLTGHYGLSKVSPHDCLWTTARNDDASKPATYERVTDTARRLTRAIRAGKALDPDHNPWNELLQGWMFEDASLYALVQALSDQDLQDLLLLLPVIAFGHDYADRLDTRDSLFNQLAHDLAVDMNEHWRPDRTFLQYRTKDQLLAIAAECNAAEALGGLPAKKSELVEALATFFAGDHPDAQAWIPGAMRFPAIDPSDPPQPEEDDDEDDTPTEAAAPAAA